MGNACLGVILGNRDFFPDHLVSESRSGLVSILKNKNITPILLDENDTKLGGVETYSDAQKCADLFKKHRNEIDGILVILPNFGDEKGVLDTIKLSGMDVPILIQAYPDNLDKLAVATRRDAYCGKISVCNNLNQAGIRYSLTKKHVVYPEENSFLNDLDEFVAVCRVVNGIRGMRIGAIGARPGAFNTVRYSEKILERNGISVTTVDLSDIISKAENLDSGAAVVKSKLHEIEEYAGDKPIKNKRIHRMAHLGVVLDEFASQNDLDALAIQCWTSIQQHYGCNICTNMSMMSEKLIPNACEVDVTGAISMYVLQLASNRPSALVDWNNNYGDEDDKCVLFHCGNWAKSFTPDMEISTAPILGTTVGEENTYGALKGRAPAGNLTFSRISTDDNEGLIKAYIGQGRLTDDELDTFGNRAVAEIPNLQKLMQFICSNGFEHHVAINQAHTADILAEALEHYLAWNVYYHHKPE